MIGATWTSLKTASLLSNLSCFTLISLSSFSYSCFDRSAILTLIFVGQQEPTTQRCAISNGLDMILKATIPQPILSSVWQGGENEDWVWRSIKSLLAIFEVSLGSLLIGYSIKYGKSDRHTKQTVQQILLTFKVTKPEFPETSYVCDPTHCGQVRLKISIRREYKAWI